MEVTRHQCVLGDLDQLKEGAIEICEMALRPTQPRDQEGVMSLFGNRLNDMLKFLDDLFCLFHDLAYAPDLGRIEIHRGLPSGWWWMKVEALWGRGGEGVSDGEPRLSGTVAAESSRSATWDYGRRFRCALELPNGMLTWRRMRLRSQNTNPSFRLNLPPERARPFPSPAPSSPQAQ